MRKLNKVVAFATAGVFSIAGLAACSNSGDSGTSTESGSQSATEEAGDVSSDIHIGAALLTQSHPYQVDLKEAMEQEAAAKGVKLTVSIADQDLDKQLSQVEDFINQDVDAIIMVPVDADGVTGAIKKAQNAGIPVVTADTPAANVEVDAHVGTDNYTGGLIAAEALAQFIDGKGDVGVITYPEVQSVRDRVEGFKKTMENYPDITIAKETPGRDRQEAKAASEDMLTSIPGLAGIFGFGDDMAIAASQAVADAGTDTVVVGFDGMDEALKTVDGDNAFYAVVVQYPDEIGKVAVDNALGLIDDEDVPANTPITPGLYVHGLGEVPVTVDGDTVTLSVK